MWTIVFKVITDKRFIIGVCLLLIAIMFQRLNFMRKEAKRREGNYEVLLNSSNESLLLTKNEIKQYVNTDAQLRKALDSLKVKAKDVDALTKTNSRTEIKFKTVVRDSLVFSYYEGVNTEPPDTLQVFKYKDSWNDIEGFISPDTVSIKITVQDTLVITNYWFKKGKWFLPKLFSKKKLRTDVVNFNPNTKYHIERRIKKLK